MEPQAKAQDNGRDGTEGIGQHQSVSPTQVADTQDDHQTVPDRVSDEGAGDPKPPNPDEGEKKGIRRGMQHGKQRELSEASDRSELALDGDRESHKGN